MNAWQQFLSQVDQERKSLRLADDQECLFRGQGDVSWPLLPTLLRYCRDAKIRKWELLHHLEANLFFEFRSRARDLHAQELSDWDVLFFMRHHGVATRLLDWTETLGVAIYFALRDAAVTATPCVWLLNPYTLNEQSWGHDDFIVPEYLLEDGYSLGDYLQDFSDDAVFPWSEPVAIYPVQRSNRLHAQRGYFTIHGENRKPLETISSHAVRQVPLSRAAIPGAQEFLSIAGIDDHSLFPDLDGLTRHLHAKYLKAWRSTA